MTTLSINRVGMPMCRAGCGGAADCPRRIRKAGAHPPWDGVGRIDCLLAAPVSVRNRSLPRGVPTAHAQKLGRGGFRPGLRAVHQINQNRHQRFELTGNCLPGSPSLNPMLPQHALVVATLCRPPKPPCRRPRRVCRHHLDCRIPRRREQLLQPFREGSARVRADEVHLPANPCSRCAAWSRFRQHPAGLYLSNSSWTAFRLNRSRESRSAALTVFVWTAG